MIYNDFYQEGKRKKKNRMVLTLSLDQDNVCLVERETQCYGIFVVHLVGFTGSKL